MPPRKIKREDLLYPEFRHWLVNGDGRLLACVQEPAPDNPEDSFDARLYYTSSDDFAYFISLEHAQAWCEKQAVAHFLKQGGSTGSTLAVQQTGEVVIKGDAG
jgi:hypothetical protein